MDRTDPSRLGDDVYIIKVERSLLKVDKQLLQCIPRLSTALENGKLQLGRPYVLDIPCQSRIAKDILHLLKRQLNNLEPFEDSQSVHPRINYTVLRLVQLLQLADSLDIEKLGSIIIDKIRSFCSDTKSLHEALKKTKSENFVFVDRALNRVFGAEDLITTELSTLTPQYNSAAKLPTISDETDSAERTGGRKRKTPTSHSLSNVFEFVCKKPKPASKDPSRNILVRSSSSPESESRDLVLDTILDFSQTTDSDEPQSKQNNIEFDEKDSGVNDDELDIDKDGFKRDQDDLDMAEPESLQLDEEKITSDDVDDLIISDPVNFECIASPQNSRRKIPFVPTQNLMNESRLSPSPSRRIMQPVTVTPLASAGRTLDKPRNFEERFSRSEIRSLPDTQYTRTQSSEAEDVHGDIQKDPDSIDDQSSLNRVISRRLPPQRFGIENFLCKTVSSEGPGSYIWVNSVGVKIYYKSKTYMGEKIFAIEYLKILQFKVANWYGDPPIVQILLRGGIIPSNLCYLVFNSHTDLTGFVTRVRQGFSNLRVIDMAPGSAETLLSAATAAYKKEGDGLISNREPRMSSSHDGNDDVVEPSREKLAVHARPVPHYMPRIDPQPSAPVGKDSETTARPSATKKKLIPVFYLPSTHKPACTTTHTI